MIRRPPRSTLSSSSAASDVYKRQIPIGHADGINRGLGNGKIGFMINDYVAKTIGNICMDMLMVDITNIDCNEGDEVSIIDDKNQTAEDFSEIINTISYEILTALSQRIKRVIIS